MSGSSWLEIPLEHCFSLANIPFGIISYDGAQEPRPAVAIGNNVLDLKVFAAGQGFADLPDSQPVIASLSNQTLNVFASLGRTIHRQVREYLQRVFAKDSPLAARLRDNTALRAASLLPLANVKTHVPMQIGDYTDFYVGKNHAYNVGVLFRGPDNALQPNYTHLPVAYHGRASSIVVSGTPVRRPWGQILDDNKKPTWHPSKKLDIELELGAFISKSTKHSSGVRVNKAEECIFGYVILNDWSARDIQAWEYVPLGPFNSKNFASSISAWVVLADALEPFRTEGIKNDSPVQPYLRQDTTKAVFDIDLQVEIKGQGAAGSSVVTRSNAKHLLWSFPQMIAHHTVGGCNLNTGDLLGSGTISGTESGSQGSLLELTNGGRSSVQIEGGERVFLEDGDEVSIRGWAKLPSGERVGFGSCRSTILAAWEHGYEE
ncbi:hypothetical protein ACHAQA_004728 [Verticillium albo-atrum]